MSVYAPDPGAVFASDAHRRVLGHLPSPGTPPTSGEDLQERIRPDANLVLDEDADELTDILKDLEADGHATENATGWRMSKKGFDALTGPNGNEPS